MARKPGSTPFADAFVGTFIDRWQDILRRHTGDETVRLAYIVHHDKRCDRLAVTCHASGKVRRFVCKAALIRVPEDVPPIILKLERFMLTVRAWAARAREIPKPPPTTKRPRGRPRLEGGTPEQIAVREKWHSDYQKRKEKRLTAAAVTAPAEAG